MTRQGELDWMHLTAEGDSEAAFLMRLSGDISNFNPSLKLCVSDMDGILVRKMGIGIYVPALTHTLQRRIKAETGKPMKEES